MKNLWNKIKNFKYKAISAFSLLALSGILYRSFDWEFLTYIMAACGLFLFGYVIVLMYHAAKNTWNDGDTSSKIIAVVYSVLALGLVGLISYLLIFKA